MPTLLPQTKAPNFTLTSDENKQVSLSDFLGKNVIIYFYPKDDTPGCTKEACMFAEMWDTYKEKDIAVIGISHDTPQSHKAFKEKYHLPFILLSDPDKKVIAEYGAKGGFMTRRISYLVNKEGMIEKVYPSVDPAIHAGEILTDIDSLV